MPVTAAAQGTASGLTLAIAARAAMTNGVVITDIRLDATCTSYHGESTASGSATLTAVAGGGSRVELCSGGNDGDRRTEVRTRPETSDLGGWKATDGVVNVSSLANTFSDPVWFYPALGSLAAIGSPDLQVAANGPDSFVIRRVPVGARGAAAALIAHAGETTYRLDPRTNLPVEVDYAVHPDVDAGTDIPVRVVFDNWHAQGGVMVPGHITRYLNGSREFEVEITSAVINTGVAATVLALQ